MEKETLTDAFAAATPKGTETPEAGTPFSYGACKTDWKSGKHVDVGWRTNDYLFHEPYASKARAMLEKLGLPVPKIGDIFHGTSHEMLFLDSHGVVVRIGPLDVKDLISPGILQPLGWLEDKETFIAVDDRNAPGNDFARKIIKTKNIPLAVAVYPGVELYSRWLGRRGDERPVVNNLLNFFYEMGQDTADVKIDNTGVIYVPDDDGKPVAVTIHIDPDNMFDSSLPKLAEKRARGMKVVENLLHNKADVLALTLQTVFDGNPKLKYLQRAFEVHQPLRHLFWQAFDGAEKGAAPDAAARDLFWAACARMVNNPQAVTMPLWRKAVNAHGKKVFSRTEACIPHVALYRPWTGEEADNPVNFRPESVRQALAAAIQKVTKEIPVRTGILPPPKG